MEPTPGSAGGHSSSDLLMSKATTEPADQSSTNKYSLGLIGVHVDRKDSQTTSSTQLTKSGTNSWKTTFFRLAPLTGIACMMAAMASIVAALGILVGSRGAAADTWTIPPSTYLAIFTAIANQALRFAAFQGIAIAWWYRAARGDTLAQLHRSWRAGMTAGGAIVSHRNMGLIGVACLCSTFVAVDGPLLQKATTIELAPYDAAPVTLNVSISQEDVKVPSDYTGGWYATDRAGRLSPSFNETIPTVHGNTSNLLNTVTAMGGYADAAWFKDVPIPGAVRGCPHARTCRATVRAPAFAVTACTHHELQVDYWSPIKNIDNVIAITGVAPPLSTLSFLVDISPIIEDYESINLITGYGRSDNCSGTFEYSICNLKSAIGEYNITVGEGGGVTLADSLPRIIALANNTRSNRKWNSKYQYYPSTLGGLAALAFQKHESAVNQYFQHGKVWQIGYTPNEYRKYEDIRASEFQKCWLYSDPQQDVLQDLNRLMFMIGVQAAYDNYSNIDIRARIDPEAQIHTTTLGYLKGSHNVFFTNLHWFAAAAVLELACIALILPTYYGWWKLGRSVSFSPLELAKAFEAPLLNDYNSNCTGSRIAKVAGELHVRYGQVNRSDADANIGVTEPKLAFADRAMVSWPEKNARFGT